MLKFSYAAFAFILAGSTAAGAAPAHPQLDGSKLPITLAANGCGIGYFRTIAGNCVPNARVRVGPDRAVILPPPCPRGFRRDPNPTRPLCYPIF